MASINYATREIVLKLVYTGAKGAGKTSNLRAIASAGKIQESYFEADNKDARGYSSDYVKMSLPQIKGFDYTYILFSAPAEDYLNALRTLVLRGVDGIIFVADSSPDAVERNLAALELLETGLKANNLNRHSRPLIYQFNKRDLANALPIEEMKSYLKLTEENFLEAVASSGVGVFTTLKVAGKQVIDIFNANYAHSLRAKSAHTETQPLASRSIPAPVQAEPHKADEFGKSESITIPHPSVFISYSSEGKEHRDWVARLAKSLRDNGVDTKVDFWETNVGSNIKNFMIGSIRESDFTILVCTPDYAKKADGLMGGVGEETELVLEEIFKKEKQGRFIPIIKNYSKTKSDALPSYLRPFLYIDFSEEDRFNACLAELLRKIYDKPKYIKPPLGKAPDFSTLEF